ncbi:hypothetical protein ACLESO_39480 [Pyxidicoccus sp. 3LG]
MKRILLPLSCLLALSACWRTTREPEWNPSQDIPPGTLVRVTLQDVKDSSRISTYIVDPRTSRILDRQDGKKALHDAQDAEQAAQATSTLRMVTTAVKVDCPPEQETEEGCIMPAIDPKHDTSGDPNPIKDLKLRRELTEKFVKLYALKILEAAHVTGVNVTVQAARQGTR